MAKVFIKDCEYMSLKGLRDGSYDPAITIDGIDYIDFDIETAIRAFTEAGLTNEEYVIIPKGTTIIDVKEFGGATEYTLSYNDKVLVLDLELDGEEDDFLEDK